MFPTSVQRVREFLESKGSKREIQRLPDSTATSQQAADALKVEVSQIAKSVVFGNSNLTVVCVLPGDRRVDSKKVSSIFNSDVLKRLSPDDVKLKTGYVIGGVCPFALPENVVLIIDESLKSSSILFAAAGDSHAVVQTSFNELIDITKGSSGHIVE